MKFSFRLWFAFKCAIIHAKHTKVQHDVDFELKFYIKQHCMNITKCGWYSTEASGQILVQQLGLVDIDKISLSFNSS